MWVLVQVYTPDINNKYMHCALHNFTPFSCRYRYVTITAITQHANQASQYPPNVFKNVNTERMACREYMDEHFNLKQLKSERIVGLHVFASWTKDLRQGYLLPINKMYWSLGGRYKNMLYRGRQLIVGTGIVFYKLNQSNRLRKPSCVSPSDLYASSGHVR